MPRKRCFKCGKNKPLDAFYPHPQMADGHLNKCKACAKSDVKKRYRSPLGREKVRAYEQQRFRQPKRKIKIREYQRNRRNGHKGKARANHAVSNALRDGRLSRKPCEVCGNPKSEAHHDDYRKKLKVRWLCFQHHREAHGQTINQ